MKIGWTNLTESSKKSYGLKMAVLLLLLLLLMMMMMMMMTMILVLVRDFLKMNCIRIFKIYYSRATHL
jgi:hypothetical protein